MSSDIMHADRISSVIEFAQHLQTTLQQGFSTTANSFPDVQPYTNILPFPVSGTSKSQRISIRQHAITIWNSCNTHAEHDDAGHRTAITECRAFAFLLLASITQRNKKSEATKLLENSLVAARDCIRADLIDLGAQVLDHSMPAVSNQSESNAGGEDGVPHELTEYFALKMLLHWKDKRPDLADYWYSRLEAVFAEVDQDISEKVIDLLLEIGTDCLDQHSFGDALKWLERARVMLGVGENAVSFAGSEIRVNVLHRMVQALAGSAGTSASPNSQHNLQRAHDTISQMRKENGPKLSILLLSLETRLGQTDVDADAALQDLTEVVNTAHTIEENHNLILSYLRQLWSQQPGKSAECFKSYIVHRLLPQGQLDRVEKTVINYLDLFLQHNATSTSEGLRSLEADLSSFQDLIGSALSSIAAQAAHGLIWRNICGFDNVGTQSVAMLLCQLGLHPLLSSAGEGSLAKFERQLVSHHLLLMNHAAATEILDKMTMVQKNNRYSRYLSYCVAVRSRNEMEAQSSLNAMLNGSGENDQLLYACVGESIKQDRHRDTARVLQRLVDQQLQLTPGIELRDLLKFTISTLIKICEGSNSTPKDEYRARLCAAFESAVQLQGKLRKVVKTNPKAERLDWKWFSERSFEIARIHAKTWSKKYIIDLLHHSSQILLTETGGLAEAILPQNQRQRLFDCDFMRIILYATEVRLVNENYSIENLPRTSYVSRSKLASSDFRHILHKQVLDIYSSLLQRQQAAITVDDDDDEKRETLSRLHILMPPAFEALLYLNASSYMSSEAMFDEMSLRQFLQTANELEAMSVTFALLADIVLTFASSDAEAQLRCNDLRIPSLVAARLLGQIVKSLREAESYDLDQAARWIRCVVQLVLDDIDKALASQSGDHARKPKHDQSLSMLESLIQQVCELASAIPGDVMSDEVETSMYPSDELQWLVSKLFNLAVDLYMLEKKELSQEWASKALKVAEVMYRVCGTVTASELIELLHRKMETMKLEVRSEC